jgi:uncharacterized protein YdaT
MKNMNIYGKKSIDEDMRLLATTTEDKSLETANNLQKEGYQSIVMIPQGK